MVEHVHIETAKPFADVAAALEARMGKFDPAVYEQLQKGADAEVVRARLEKMAGPSGFMPATTEPCCVSPAKRKKHSSISSAIPCSPFR